MLHPRAGKRAPTSDHTRLQTPDIPIEIEFSPIIEQLAVGQGQIVTITVRNVLLHPLLVQIAVTLNALLLTQAEVDLGERPWKFPFPLIGELAGSLVYTVEVVPLERKIR